MANPQGRKTASSAKQWKKRVSGILLTLPSGEVCKVKRPGMEKILKAGIMPDTLTPIAMGHVSRGEHGRVVKSVTDDVDKEIMEKVLQDPEKLSELFLSFDKAVVMCVIDPKVRLHIWTQDDALLGLCPADKVGEEIPEDDRDDTILYTDEVDQADKLFIFNYVVGGSSDLELFRKQYGSALADMES